MKIGFVGLGNMGEPMCRRVLESGFEVSVYDVNPEAVLSLGDTAAEPAENLKALAAFADVVLLSLPDSDVVERVVLGDEGLAEELSSGKVLIDTSSSRPSSTRTIAKRLDGAGIEMLDAPVSGGVLRAEEGKLAVMIGGKREVFERCYEVFQAFGEKIFHVGGHGTGHLVKSLNNLLSATTLASAAEAVFFSPARLASPQRCSSRC
jgi:3-hydroxyisobutyrate dehydrogenase-like beta-hydroxyacid dehydrogenase